MWLSSSLASRRSNFRAIATSQRHPTWLRPGVEALEDRSVPALLAPELYASDGVTAVGDFDNDGVVETRAGAAGDFNRDGDLDLVDLVGVRLGNGDGTFQSARPFTLPKMHGLVQSPGALAA